MTLPIVDDNVKLMLVQALIDAEVLPALDRRQFVLDHDLPRGEGERNEAELAAFDAAAEAGEIDDEDPDYRKLYEIESELLSWLRPEHLPLVESANWGGGKAVQHWIWKFWDGESDEFDLTDLTGIAACTRLRRLSLWACCAVRDLTPLTGMTTLEALEISGPGDAPLELRPLTTLSRLTTLALAHQPQLTDASPLTALTRLRELTLSSTGVADLSFALALPQLTKLNASGFTGKSLADANVATLVELRARGVNVQVR